MGNVGNRRVKFGTGFLAGNELRHTIRMAKLAEEMGFSSCWIAEDYFYGGAFSTATACAMETQSIDIGIGVVNPYTRHPVLTTMELAAFDAISEGRAILGLGASNGRWIEEQMGIPYKKPLTSVKESAEIISGLLKEKEIHYKGTYFETGKVELNFKPYRPHVPLYLGVKGPKALHMAGKVADGVLTSTMSSLPYIRYVKEQVARGAQEANRNPDEIKIASYLVFSISENRDEARAAVKPLIAKYLGIHGKHPILTTTGMPEHDILAFREAFLQGTDATHLITDWMIDTFSVSGTPEECRQRLNSLIDAGLDYPIAFEIPGIPVEETMKQVYTHLIAR